MNELVKENVVLQMKNIHKNFTGVKALQAVDFSLREGEIHALMGENGAGKSTLIKVLTGVYEKDEGEIFLAGSDKAVEIHSPQDAQNLGISTVYQEITLCPNLSVAENMFIGRTKGVGQNWKKMNEDADKILKSLDIPAKATQQLSSCSIAIQQMVAIARAVDMDCKVLILDEPTSSLDDKEVQKLFGLMKDLKARGVGIIFVTHFLDQVYEVCDRITVLRDGKLVGEYEIEKLPRVQLVAKMLGKELDDEAQIKDETQIYHADESVPPVFEVEQLQSNAGIKPFDFYIRKGEVNGFTGLLGSGRSECVRAIFGADRVIGGKIKKNGKEASRVYFHPGDMTHTNEYGSFLFAHFIARELSKLDPLTFAIDVQDEEDFTPDEHTAVLTGTSTAAGNQDEQKEVFDAMERAGDNLVAAVEKAKKDAEMMK